VKGGYAEDGRWLERPQPENQGRTAPSTAQSARFSTSGSLINGQFTTTFVAHASITGPGRGNNLYFPANFDLTMNANGEVTANVEQGGDVECR
jgi:hypothetical protein